MPWFQLLGNCVQKEFSHAKLMDFEQVYRTAKKSWALGSFSSFASVSVERILLPLSDVAQEFNEGNVKRGCFNLGKTTALIEVYQDIKVNQNKTERSEEIRRTLIWSKGLAESGLCTDEGNPSHTHLPSQMGIFAQDLVSVF